MSVAWLFSTTNTSYKTLFRCHFQYNQFLNCWYFIKYKNDLTERLTIYNVTIYNKVMKLKNMCFVFSDILHSYKIKLQRTTNWGKSIISHSSLEGYNTWFDKCEACTPYCYINFYINVTPYQYSFHSIFTYNFFLLQFTDENIVSTSDK